MDDDSNAVLSTGRNDFQDPWFTILYRVKPYCVEFDVLEMESYDDARTPRYRMPYSEETPCDDTEDPSLAEKFITGHVKWDGCTNLDGFSHHACSREQLTRIGTILGECWDLVKLCPNWIDKP